MFDPKFIGCFVLKGIIVIISEVGFQEGIFIDIVCIGKKDSFICVVCLTFREGIVLVKSICIFILQS